MPDRLKQLEKEIKLLEKQKTLLEMIIELKKLAKDYPEYRPTPYPWRVYPQTPIPNNPPWNNPNWPGYTFVCDSITDCVCGGD